MPAGGNGLIANEPRQCPGEGKHYVLMTELQKLAGSKKIERDFTDDAEDQKPEKVSFSAARMQETL